MRIRRSISQLIYTYLLSVIAFATILKEMSLDIFLAIYATFFLLVIIALDCNSSAVYKIKACMLETAVWLGFLSVKLISGHSMAAIVVSHDVCRNILGVFIFIEYFYIVICIYISKKKERLNPKSEQNVSQKIYDERNYDLKRLEQYIEKYNKVGVQGEWGCGKTYLVDEYIKKNADKYEVIRIETLTCNLDSIDSFIFKQLENILWNNGIYPSYSKCIYDLLDKNSFLSNLKLSFYKGSIDRTTAFQGFCEDLSKLQKTVLLVCEDIDRISENYVNQIAKLLDIADRLSGNNVKVIYEYSQTKMAALGFGYEYMEKYVPYVINLTDIPFSESINQALEEEKELNGSLVNDDFKFLTYPIYIDTNLQKLLKIDFCLEIQLNGVEPRKIKEFVNEVNLAMKNQIYEKNKKITILYYYIKIFMWEIYEDLVFAEDIEEELKFEIIKRDTGKTYYYNIKQLVNWINCENVSPEEVKAIFCGNESEKEEQYIIRNRNKLGIMILMGLDFNLLKTCYEEQNSGNDRNLRNPDLEQDNINIKRMERNLKINKLFKNLYMNGKSEYTNREAVAKEFIDKVLLSEEDKHEENWKNLLENCFKSSIYKDNTTIFRLMGDDFVPLSQAIRVVINSEEYDNKIDSIKDKFYQFWENHMKEDLDITLDKICVFNSLEAENGIEFRKAITLFNKLKVAGNMNTEHLYVEFLDTYLNTAMRLGYISSSYYGVMKSVGILNDERIEYVKKMLNNIKVSLEKDIESGMYPESAKEDIMQFKQFLDKNMKIISSTNKVKQRGPRIEQTISQRKDYVNEKVYNRLNSIIQKNISKEDYKRFLNEEYDRENINLSEYRTLIKKKLNHQK